MLRLALIAGLLMAMLVSAAIGDTRLADAVEQGNTEVVHALLKAKVDVNAAQGDGMTALHWAAQRDDLATAKLLLAAGANVKAETRMGGMTPLFMAAKNGSALMIEALLKAGADPNKADGTGVTPLMFAAASGNTDAIQVLLDHGVNVNAGESAHGQRALVFAAAYNRGPAIKLLIAHGANPELPTKVLDPGCGSTFNRDECEEVDQFGVAIQNKRKDELPGKDNKDGSNGGATKVATANAPSNKGGGETEKLTPAQSTKAKEEKENAQRRRNGAKVTGGMTPLLFAARDGQADAARALVEAGADVNDPGTGEKMTPLVMAIANGHYDLAMYFLDHGGDPNKASAVGLTPLFAVLDMEWAGYSWLPQPVTYREKTTYLDLMKALLAKGANPNAKLGGKVWFRNLAGDHGWVDPAGATPFWRAAQATDLTAMHMLIDAGADPKIPSANGTTALMVAAGIGWAANFSRTAPDSWIKAVQYCLDLGIDVNAKDNKDYTALFGAAFRGDTKLVEFLASKGARVDIINKDGFSAADMANGPIEHSAQHPDTIGLLVTLGSPFANDCRSTNCFIIDGKERKRIGG